MKKARRQCRCVTFDVDGDRFRCVHYTTKPNGICATCDSQYACAGRRLIKLIQKGDSRIMKIGRFYFITAKLDKAGPVTREQVVQTIDSKLLDRYNSVMTLPSIAFGYSRRLFAVGVLTPATSFESVPY